MYIDVDENAGISRKIMGFMITAAEKCVSDEGLDPSKIEISLSVVSEDEIHELNKRFRDVDRPTDVLSFPQYDSPQDISPEEPVTALGDVVICDAVAHRQAEEYGHSYEREFVYLFVHSVLHLLGYDHMEAAEKKVMRAREEEVMSYIGLERGFTPAEDADAPDGDGSGDEGPSVMAVGPDDDSGAGTDPDEDEMEKYEELMGDAVSASENSYAPYSGFHVGAALLAADGSVYTGVNVENASYGATICAERSAISAAVTDGQRNFDAIAIYSPDGEASPCGICRQVLLEFGDDIEVVTYDADRHITVQELSELMPKGFAL